MTEETPTIETLEDAQKRIGELERALDESISVILKRDERLEAYERRILTLKQMLEDAGIDVPAHPTDAP